MQITEERLRSLLVEGDFLSSDEFETAKEQSERHSWTVPQAVVELGYMSDAQVAQLMAEEFGFFYVDLAKEPVDTELLTSIPERVAKAQQAVLYKKEKDVVRIATPRVDNYEFFKLIEKRLLEPVQIDYTSAIGVEVALKKYQRDLLEQVKALLKTMKERERDEDVVKMVRLLLESAYEKRASDIHIEPEKNEVIVRFRIDGRMHDVLHYPIEYHEKVVFRVKILSRLRTDEHAQAQDGRFEIAIDGNDVNFRVSILPVTHGENIVMRLLSEGFQRLRLEDLGLQSDDLQRVKHAATLPHGMVLSTGPTGSGKTTTLYALLVILNQQDVNVMTIEDPVEYSVRGVRQIQVNARTNLTFETGLRSIVRQDPDIIMVGEIRDPQTAGIAINASLTGHLLLSTLHANDTAAAFPRLYEMGVEPFLIASSVNVIVAQRLVRRVCSHCVGSYSPDKEELLAIQGDRVLLDTVKHVSGKKDLKQIRLYKGKGCAVCSHTGYLGRMGVFEVMEVTEKIRPLIVNNASSDQIRDAAREEGMRTMLVDGVEKVFQGQTTIREVIRVTKT